MDASQYKEKLKHGTADFPAAMYLLDRFHPRYIMVPHWHIEYEIMYVTGGTFHLTLDGKQMIVNTEDLCFFPSGVIHSGTPKRGCSYKCLVFSLSLLRNKQFSAGNYIQRLADRELDIIPVVRKEDYADKPDLQYLARTIFSLSDFSQDEAKLELAGGLMLLFAALSRHRFCVEPYPASDKLSYRIGQIKAAVELIQSSYDQNLSLHDMAGAAGLSEKYFCQFFKKLTQKTPVEYLNLYRIEQASSLIANTEESLMEISLSCGFSDYCYFSRVFRKVTGLSPSAYRKEQALKEEAQAPSSS